MSNENELYKWMKIYEQAKRDGDVKMIEKASKKIQEIHDKQVK